jgi:hypothetical protein
MDILSWYYNSVMDDFLDWVYDNISYHNEQSFDEIYDEMSLEVSGNDTGRRMGFHRNSAATILFNDEFLTYIKDLGADLQEIILNHGAEGVDVWAAYFILEKHYDKFQEEWNERCTQYNFGKY